MEAEQIKSKLNIEKMKRGLAVVEDYVNKALYSDFFIIAFLAIAFITWVTECATFGFITLGLVLSFVLVFAYDILPLFAGLFSAALMLYTKDMKVILPLWPVFIPLGIALIVFVVRNSLRKKQAGDKFEFGKLFFPQLAVSVALLLGGVSVMSGEVYLGALPSILGLGVAGLAVYILARNFIVKDDGIDKPTYFAKVLAYIGVVIAIQLIVVMAKSGIDPEKWAKVVWHVGWGNRNNISTYMLFTAPMCLYLSTKYRYGIVYLLMGALQYICLVMTFSRGGILFGFIGMLFGIAFIIYKSKNRKRLLISAGIVAAVMLVVYLIFMKDLNNIIGSLISRGTGLSGRERLYQEAWELFKENPFLGCGLGFVGKEGAYGDAIRMYWFHSTFFQVLACMGIIGILAYGYSYVMKGIVLCKNLRSSFNLFVIVVFIGFEGYSMMDTGTFIPGAYLLIVLILMCLVEMFTSTREAIALDKQDMKKPVADNETVEKLTTESSVCQGNDNEEGMAQLSLESENEAPQQLPENPIEITAE